MSDYRSSCCGRYPDPTSLYIVNGKRFDICPICHPICHYLYIHHRKSPKDAAAYTMPLDALREDSNMACMIAMAAVHS